MIVVMTNRRTADQEAAPGESSLGSVKPIQTAKTMEGSMESSFPDVIKFIEQLPCGKKEIQPCDSRTFHGRFPFFAYI